MYGTPETDISAQMGRQFAPLIAFSSEGATEVFPVVLRQYNQSVARVRYQLAAIFTCANVPFVMQTRIFDLSQLWFCVGEEAQAKVHDIGTDSFYRSPVKYQSFDPSLHCSSCHAQTLRAIRYAVKIQGWPPDPTQVHPWDRDPWVWVERQLLTNKAKIVAAELAYIKRRANSEVALYQEDHATSSHFVRSWKPGVRVVMYAQPMFTTETLFVERSRILTFHCF